MKYNISLNRPSDITYLKEIPFQEVVIHPTSLSKTGEISNKELSQIICHLHQEKKSPVLLWDAVCHDHDFPQVEALLKQLPISLLAAIRFQDPGVGAFLKKNFPQTPLHMSVEIGNHNQEGILAWLDYFSSQLTRVILSNEIPVSTIESFRKNIQVEVELQGAGRIEIFHTPRSLLKHHLFPEQKEQIPIKLTAASEDRPTQVNALVEGQQGTLMFYNQDLYILHSQEQLQSAKIDYLRLDLYEEEQFENLIECLQAKNWQEEFKKRWKKKTTKGFFRSNKTHAPLVRLTNRYLQESKAGKLGDVIEYVKGSHLAVNFWKEVSIPQTFNLHSPEGRVLQMDLKSAKNLQEQEFFQGELAPGVYIIPWVKHAVPSTVIKYSPS